MTRFNMTRFSPMPSITVMRRPGVSTRPAALALLLVLALCAPFGAALAQQLPPPPPPNDASATQLPAWEQLSPAQRDALIAAFRDRWNQNPQQRARIMRYAQRWQQMSPEQRQRAQQGQLRWESMTPEQRKQARAAFEQGQSMTPEQRAALREKLKAMTPEQRREWIEHNRGQFRGLHHRGQGKFGPRPFDPNQPPPPPPPPQEQRR